jgi:hypothetical protein
MVDYYRFRKGTGNPEDRFVTNEEQQHSVDEVLLFGDDEEIIRENPDIDAKQSAQYDGVRFKALERAVAMLAQSFYEYRERAAESGVTNYPRIEVLVDTNCLVTFTGPLDEFDKEYFLTVLDMTIEGRLGIEDAKDQPDCVEERANPPYHG